MAEQLCLSWYFFLIYCVVFTVIGMSIVSYINIMNKRMINKQEFVEISQV